MSKTMQDKETKKRFDNFVTEECGDSLWGNDGTDNYDTAYDVKDKVWDFISKLEQEAERRGYEKGWEDGSKGKVFEKIEVETEVTFKDLRDVIEGKEDAGEFLSKLTTK